MYKEMILTVVQGANKRLNAVELRKLIEVPKDDNELFDKALSQLVLVEHKLYFVA